MRTSAITLLVGLAAAGLGAAVDVQAQRLGRLFTTPEERALLDELRAEERVARPEAEPEPEPKPAPEPGPPRSVVSRLTINGFVRGSRGPETVWINGDLVEHGSVTREGISVESARGADSSVRLVLPSGTGTVALRPGEQIDIRSGTVLDAYEAQVGGDEPSAFSPTGRAVNTTAAPPATSNVDSDRETRSTLSPEERQRLAEEARRRLESAPGGDNGQPNVRPPGS